MTLNQTNVTSRQTNNMTIEVKQQVRTKLTNYEIEFDLPTKAAVTAEMIFASSSRNCSSTMSSMMFGSVKGSWFRGDDRVVFTVYFSDNGWSKRLMNALTDYDLDDPDRQDEIDELVELIEKTR